MANDNDDDNDNDNGDDNDNDTDNDDNDNDYQNDDNNRRLCTSVTKKRATLALVVAPRAAKRRSCFRHCPAQ